MATDFVLGMNAKLYYADELNFSRVSESATYLNLSAGYKLMDNLSLSAGVGFSDGDAFETLGGPTGPDSYMDYSIGVATSFAGADFSLAYVDSNDDAEDLFGDSITDDRAVLKMSKSF